MKGRYYTIQIIPEDSEKVRKFKVRIWWFAFIKISLIVFILVLGLFIYHLGKINRIVANYEKMRMTNAQLVKKDNNYEEMFARLDSLWILENRIQNIFETFLENDSGKINSIIDKNKFAHTPVEKIQVDYEGIHGWQPMSEKIKLEHIPSVLPVVGIESKKFSEEDNHLGVDISAQAGNPVFASGAGNVIFAGSKDELGNTIIIDHQNGYKSSYSHLKTINVRKGHTVGKGDIIGTVGSTGKTSGAHLHFEISKDGINVDPSNFINY